MDSIKRIECALAQLDGNSITHELSQIAKIPDTGFLAGQALASVVMSRLGILKNGPINDIDVFMPIQSSERARQMAHKAQSSTFKRKSDLARHVTEASAAMHGDSYGRVMQSTVKQGYQIKATSRIGMLNEVAYERTHSMPGVEEARALINGFDLDCAQIALNPNTGKITWTSHFSKFLQTFELGIQNASTPFHSASRYFRKKRELGCLGDDELNMAICSFPSLLGAFEPCPNRLRGESKFPIVAGRYGQKSHADFLNFRNEIEPWFQEIKASDKSLLWTMSPREDAHPNTLGNLKNAIKALDDRPLGSNEYIAEYLIANARAFCLTALQPNPELDLRQIQLEKMLTQSGRACESSFLALNARLRLDPTLLNGGDMEQIASKVVKAIGTYRILSHEFSSLDLLDQARASDLLHSAQERNAALLASFDKYEQSVFSLAAGTNDYKKNGETFARVTASDSAADIEILSFALAKNTVQNDAASLEDLLAKGANPALSFGYSHDNALHNASKEGSTDAVRLLLAHPGVNAGAPNHEGATPLMLAAYKGHAEICELLLEHSNLKATDSDGETALIHAIRGGSLECVAKLITPSGCLSEFERHGKKQTALLLAATRNTLEAGKVLDLLLKHSSPRDMNEGGQSALMLAAIHAPALCKHLIGPCDPSWVDFKGMNALMHSCANNNKEAFDLLIANGDPWAMDLEGNDCLSHAEIHQSHQFYGITDDGIIKQLLAMLDAQYEREEILAVTVKSTPMNAEQVSKVPKRQPRI